MTPFDETVEIIRAFVTDDTSSIGLNNSASPAYLRGRDDSNVGVWRAGDTNLRTMIEPFVVVSLDGQQEIDKIVTAGGGSSGDRQQVAMVVRLEVVSKADNRFVNQNAIVARLRDLLHTASFNGITGQDDWNMNRMIFVTEGQVPTSEEDNRMRYFIRARLDARRSAA